MGLSLERGLIVGMYYGHPGREYANGRRKAILCAQNGDDFAVESETGPRNAR